MTASTLVIQPLPGIGDMVWHLPCLHAIAAHSPGKRIDILTKPRSKADQLLAGDPAVDSVLWLQRERGRHKGLRGLLRLAGELCDRHYQSVWILHNSPRYVLAVRLAGIPERIGYGPRWRGLLLNHLVHFSHDELKRHPLEKSELLLDKLGWRERQAEPELPVVPEAVTTVSERYRELNTPWLAVGIGSSEPFKQWGVQNFAELCVQLGSEMAAGLILVGGPAEQDMAEAIIRQAAAEGVTVVSALDLTIADMAALLSQCRLYVGNDTGFLNIAAATGVESIGLFGGSPPLTHSSRIHCILPEDGSVPWYGSKFMNRIGVPAVLKEVRTIMKGN